MSYCVSRTLLRMHLTMGVCRLLCCVRLAIFFLFQFSTRFEKPSAHHQESKIYQYDLWYVSLYICDRVVCNQYINTTTTDTPDDELGCSKHVENWNKQT